MIPKQNEKIFFHLKNLYEQKKLPQVLLFSSKNSNIKNEFALSIASLPFSSSDYQKIAQGLHDEVFVPQIPDDESIQKNIIDQIQDHLSIKSISHQHTKHIFRGVILYNIERLTHQAANSFLKILEEPPEGTQIFLTCSKPDQLLPTIRSRVLNIVLRNEPHEKTISEKNFDFAVLENLSLSSLVSEIQRMTKSKKWSIENFIHDYELFLNERYRGKDFPLGDNRRLKLHQIYKYAIKQHISLNANLLCETILMKENL